MFCKKNKNIFNKILRTEGAAVLLTVIMISATILVIACGASVLGLGEVGMDYAATQGNVALSYAESCSEEAIFRLKEDSSYIATNYSLPIGNGSCIINIGASGNNRTVRVQGKNGDYNKRIQIDGTYISGVFTITNWQEVSA